MLEKLKWGGRARLVAETLADCKDGLVAVVDAQPLAHLLREDNPRVVLVAGAAPRGYDGETVIAASAALPFVESLAALVVPMAGEEQLAAWTAAVKTGGKLVIVDREDAEEASRRLLCIGLTDPEQRRGTRAVVTSGRVWRAA